MSGYTLDDLARDLKAAAVSAGPDVEKVVKRGAVNIKKAWRTSTTGLAHAPAFPYSIGFDEVAPLVYEIGPDKNLPQGPLGNLIEYGSVNNAPHNDGQRALDAEAPRTARYILDALVDRLKG